MTAAVGTVAALDHGRWEVIRALGAAITTPPPANATVRRALDLPPETAAEYTDAYVLGLPPHAAIYLGAEGMLGGDGLDRVGGFWRALGLTAPSDADHLGVLLMLYAELGAAESGRVDDRGRAQLRRARTTLFHEHIASWAGMYLAALNRLGIAAASAWSRLALDALTTEAVPGAALPAALRDAPRATPGSLDATLDALVSPVRSAIVLSQRDLAVAAARLGVGLRRGERRFALSAMLRQDPVGTLRWAAGEARQWASLHTDAALVSGAVPTWWTERATATATMLERCAAGR